MRLLAILRKEFIQMRRDPRTLAIIVVMPALLLFIFGYAINTVVDHIPTIVDDESQDQMSRAFIAAFQNSGYFTIVGSVTSRDDARKAIDDGQAKAALIIAPDFEAQVLRGQDAAVQFVIDGSDPNTAQTALFAGGMVAQVRSADLLTSMLQRLGRGAPSAGVDLRPVVLYNPGMLSVTFMIPGLIGMILQFQALNLTALAVVRERERGTLEQLVVTPIRPWELMLGKILPYTLTASLAVIVALLVGRFWFGVQIAGSLPLLAVTALIFLLGSLGIGLLVSTVSQTQMQAIQFAALIQLPSMLLSGFLFSRQAMPLPLQVVGLAIPLTYYLPVLRGIMLKGVGVGILWPSVLPLAVFGVLIFILSVNRFQKRLA